MCLYCFVAPHLMGLYMEPNNSVLGLDDSALAAIGRCLPAGVFPFVRMTIGFCLMSGQVALSFVRGRAAFCSLA